MFIMLSMNNSNSTDMQEVTEERKNLRRKTPIVLLITFLYALFYAWGLYDSDTGVMFLLFTLATAVYFFLVTKILGFTGRKIQYIFAVSLILLGFSQFTSDSSEIHFYNTFVFALLILLWMLTVSCDCSDWGIGTYVTALFQASVGCVKYLGEVFLEAADKVLNFFGRNMTNERRKVIKNIGLGFLFGIPVVFVMILLLSSSDAIFRHVIEMIPEIHISEKCAEIIILTILLSIYLYLFLVGISKRAIKKKYKERNVMNAVTAVTAYSLLALPYLLFSGIQIGGLILKKLSLPEGYTYAGYAREGFFSLLFVCVLNIFFVIIGKLYFEENKALRIVLNIISFCTIIMIVSSALKMYMYITAYGMTRLRFKVVLSLVIILLIMLGVILWLNRRRFPLLVYSAAVFLVGFLTFSLSKPDYWIAKYNLEHYDAVLFGGYEIARGDETSLDAVPAIFEYLEEHGIKEEDDMPLWMSEYQRVAEKKYNNMKTKDFNYSVYRAVKLFQINDCTSE